MHHGHLPEQLVSGPRLRRRQPRPGKHHQGGVTCCPGRSSISSSASSTRRRQPPWPWAPSLMTPSTSGTSGSKVFHRIHGPPLRLLPRSTSPRPATPDRQEEESQDSSSLALTHMEVACEPADVKPSPRLVPLAVLPTPAPLPATTTTTTTTSRSGRLGRFSWPWTSTCGPPSTSCADYAPQAGVAAAVLSSTVFDEVKRVREFMSV